jgi:hypothetical protein
METPIDEKALADIVGGKNAQGVMTQLKAIAEAVDGGGPTSFAEYDERLRLHSLAEVFFALCQNILANSEMSPEQKAEALRQAGSDLGERLKLPATGGKIGRPTNESRSPTAKFVAPYLDMLRAMGGK